MLLQKSVYEYAPTIMLLLIFMVYTTLAIMYIIKRDRLKKRAIEREYIEGEKLSKILHYYSYECFLFDYYMSKKETSIACLHRNYACSLRRALTYAGVSNDVITEYEKMEVERL